jgi:gamma-glutamyltranspeptidase/glutathione hydrolase
LAWSQAEQKLIGLNGSGRAPSGHTLEALSAAGHDQIPETGIWSATVPGTVDTWQTLHARCGRRPFADVLAPAIRLAEEGFAVAEIVAHYWNGSVVLGRLTNEAAQQTWAPGGKAPRAGDWFQAPALGRTLRQIAEGGASAFYEGAVADAIVETSRSLGGGFSHEDLAAHTSSWVEPISTDYRGTTVAEMPPNGQGITALLGLNILENFDPEEAPAGSGLEWHRRIEAIKLAFADRDAYVADPERASVPVEALLDKAYARERASLIGDQALVGAAPGLGSDTVYCCAADAEGNLVSFIQSLFGPFGSGVGCGDTGVVLQNRGAGFRSDPAHPNALAPGKRPFHTIIPGMLLEAGVPRMAFGIMGGHVQAQAHLGFVSNLVDHGMNAQEAIDRARFRYEGGRRVKVERPDVATPEGATLGASLEARGHVVERPLERMAGFFGGGQAIERLPNNVLAGASDRRKDGQALGFHGGS